MGFGSAALPSVHDLVEELTVSFELGLNLYSQWRRRRGQLNHYRKPKPKPKQDRQSSSSLVLCPSSSSSLSNCALSTSLSIGSRIRVSFALGQRIFGRLFSSGDASSRRLLSAQIALLHDHLLPSLRAALAALDARPSTPRPLDLQLLLQVSETARLAAMQALAELYQRLAVVSGRTDEVPDFPRQVSSCSFSPPSPSPSLSLPPPSTRWLVPPDEDARTTAWSVLSTPLAFSSEPPSPPLTPTELDFGVSSITPESSRPANSVFHIFCPEAMALQVDVRRPVPAVLRPTCRCGFRWWPDDDGIDDCQDANNKLKDGFVLSTRFLAKSHCQGPDAGYGCVLCTSHGVAARYDSVAALQMHVNAVHSKWQMLHDRDLTRGILCR